MMNSMISYTTSVLQAIATFLGTEPIIYLFGVIVACFVVGMIKQIMWGRG